MGLSTDIGLLSRFGVPVFVSYVKVLREIRKCTMRKEEKDMSKRKNEERRYTKEGGDIDCKWK